MNTTTTTTTTMTTMNFHTFSQRINHGVVTALPQIALAYLLIAVASFRGDEAAFITSATWGVAPMIFLGMPWSLSLTNGTPYGQLFAALVASGAYMMNCMLLSLVWRKSHYVGIAVAAVCLTLAIVS